MSKVGRFVTDPKAGAYCQITLDSGEKILVSHPKGGTKGGPLIIEKPGWLGLGSQQVLTCDLDSPAGQAALGRLAQGAPPDSARATPLGAFVEYAKDFKSIEDLRAGWQGLLAQPPR
jgi:hypothetical protein